MRDYDSRPLAPRLLRRILEAGRLAGSARNRQARRLVILTDHTRTAEAFYAPGNVLGAAPVVAGRGQPGLTPAAPPQNMMLAAHDEGIGSCPNGASDADAPAAIAGVEEGEQIATVLSFGYPARP